MSKKLVVVKGSILQPEPIVWARKDGSTIVLYVYAAAVSSKLAVGSGSVFQTESSVYARKDEMFEQVANDTHDDVDNDPSADSCLGGRHDE